MKPKNIIATNKGIILFMVLSIILVVVALANVVLMLLSSQSRLTHHQISRIQAYYAAQAGINYALERLRTGAWTFSPTNSCPDPTGCILTDSDFTHTVRQVRIIFCRVGSICASTSTPCNPPTGINFCINTSINYTYTP